MALNIAVVGAGPAGMAMARQISDVAARTGFVIPFSVFEKRDDVGGLWQYEDPVDQADLMSERGGEGGKRRERLQSRLAPNAMYEGLRTNIPMDLMTYRDSPSAPGLSLFPSRGQVLDYLKGYAEKHKLHQYIRFNTIVSNLKKDDQGEQWLLTSRSSQPDSPTNEISEAFSHVVICHGRCSLPHIPSIDGLDSFPGKVMHSACYRDPSELTEREVLVVGNGSSGIDIARELSGFICRDLPSGFSPTQWKERCKEDPFQVYSSWHSLDNPPPMDFNPLDPDSPQWCRQIKVTDQIDYFKGKDIHLKDGRVLDNIKVVIFATGFLFDNAYIDQSTGSLLTRPLLPPSSNSNPCKSGIPSSRLYNLDHWQLFHSHDESIAFLGVPNRIVPFPFSEAQASYVIHRWLGMASKLPRLDSSIPPTEPARWSSRPQGSDASQGGTGVNGKTDVVLEETTHVFGFPSEAAYIDALMSMLRPTYPDAGIEPPWETDFQSDGLGNGSPKGPEVRFATTQWRRERRANGKQLRRETLGY